jgi:hypothetical protein
MSSIRFTVQSEWKLEELANRLCDLFYGSGCRPVPDTADGVIDYPDRPTRAFVGAMNDCWLYPIDDRSYRIDFRYAPKPDELVAIEAVLVWTGIAVRRARGTNDGT